ncbi:MAG: DnaB-like helicase N-terminal domain-containing protein, partial [Candidatus Pacebacteria bacterium]|nr:DnaB-like helicase N-terminal domain-containing protein [Candidatus Paceibacterota bacterium]
MAIIQVIGSLIKNPTLLLEDNYTLRTSDFPERFHQIIFSAIYNLINTGIKELDIITIDNYISQYEKQYVVFNSNNGVQYLEGCIELANVRNFKYYYDRLRKFALLKTLNEKGFDIKEIYDDSLIDVKMQ